MLKAKATINLKSIFLSTVFFGLILSLLSIPSPAAARIANGTLSPASSASLYGIRSDDDNVGAWYFKNNQWEYYEIALPSASPPSFTTITAPNNTDIYGVRSDTGKIGVWRYTNSWNYFDINVGPSFLTIAAEDYANIFGIRSDNGQIGQLVDNNNHWQYFDLGGPAVSSLDVPPGSAVFGIRKDTGAIGEWSYSGGWNYGDLGGPAVSAISAPDDTHVFGIRSDTGKIERWDVNGYTDLGGPSLSALVAVDNRHVYGIRSDTGQIGQLVSIDGHVWGYTDFGGPSFTTIVAPDVAHIFGTLSTGVVGSWTLNGAVWQYAEVDIAGWSQQPTVSGWTNPAFSTPIFPKSRMIGVNEPFAVEESTILTMKPIQLTNFPGNIAPHTLAEDQRVLAALAGGHHIGMYRDIIPVEMIAPAKIGGHTYWSQIRNTLTMFKYYNLDVIISFGAPLPQWMVPPGQSPWCFIPSDGSDWQTLKNNLGFAIGGVVSAMAADPILKDWFTTHVQVEGFNEFDGLGTMKAGACQPMQGTPEKAADLQNGIQYVLNQNKTSVQTLMPSNGGSAQFLHDYYYSYNGSGLPNVHMYINGSTADDVMRSVRVKLAGIQNALPLKLRNRIYIGETGEARATDLCKAGSNWALPDGLSAGASAGSERQKFYTMMLSDPIVSNAAEARLFWRLYDLPDTTPTDADVGTDDPCELHAGLIDIKGNETDILRFITMGI